MTRPEDYGDNFPSDTGDEIPGNPTDGFAEVDYRIEGLEAENRPLKGPRDFIPSPLIEDPEPPEQETWSGIIVKWLNGLKDFPRRYMVLREDGKYHEAFSWTVLPFEEYKPGHDVVIQRVNIKDQVPLIPEDIYVIVGKPRPQESQIVDLYCSEQACYNTPFIVPFSATKARMPPFADADHFSDPAPDHWKIDAVGVGQIRVLQDTRAMYHIEYTINLELDKPDPRIADLRVELGCWLPDDLEYTLEEEDTPKLWFNRQNGFHLQKRTDCTTSLMLGSRNCKDSILNQQDLDKPAYWTNSPQFGGNIRLGTDQGTAWIKFGNPDQDFLWLGEQGGKLKFKFPSAAPTKNNAIMVALRTDGEEVVEAGWEEDGVSGTVNIQTSTIASWVYTYVPLPGDWTGYEGCMTGVIENGGCYSFPVARPVYEDCTLTIRNGVVVGGCGLVNAPAPESPIAYDWDPCKSDPCEYED